MCVCIYIYDIYSIYIYMLYIYTRCFMRKRARREPPRAGDAPHTPHALAPPSRRPVPPEHHAPLIHHRPSGEEWPGSRRLTCQRALRNHTISSRTSRRGGGGQCDTPAPRSTTSGAHCALAAGGGCHVATALPLPRPPLAPATHFLFF